MIISYTELCDKVGRLIPEKRMRHSAGVAQVSAELADRFLLDADTARYIGIYHDAYRYSCDGSTPAYCREHGIEVFPEEDADPMLLHGALAAIHFDEARSRSSIRVPCATIRSAQMGWVSMAPYAISRIIRSRGAGISMMRAEGISSPPLPLRR